MWRRWDKFCTVYYWGVNSNKIAEFVKRERIIIRLQIIGFKFEVLVFSLVSKTLEFSAIVVGR